MTHEEFFAQVKQGEIARVYLFEGEEEHIKSKALEALRQKILPEGLEALNETILTNPPAGDIIAAAETLPMMADRRLILVRDSVLLAGNKAAGESEDGAKLATYLENAPETSCIVFYVRGLVDGRKKLALFLRKKAAHVKFDRLSDAGLHRWMQTQLGRMGKQLSPADASLLAFTAGNDLLVLTQELSKLAAFVGERGEVTRADIETVVTPTLECTVFQMVDAIVAGKETDAFRLLSVMLENGEARIGILAMMTRQYRNLLHLKLMQEGRVAQDEIAKRIGVPPFALRRLEAQARGADVKVLRGKLDLCVDTDFAIKSGKMREDAALERAIFMLCA